jgi:hypothetical protein
MLMTPGFTAESSLAPRLVLRRAKRDRRSTATRFVPAAIGVTGGGGTTCREECFNKWLDCWSRIEVKESVPGGVDPGDACNASFRICKYICTRRGTGGVT